MNTEKKLWLTLTAVLGVTFALLGFFGREVYRQAPPVPQRFVVQDGPVLFTHDDVIQGQLAWQSTGGQQLGSVWGHGAYQAPDWTADWLHRELMAWLELAARERHGQPYEALTPEQQAALKLQLKGEYRTNTYDAASGTVTLSPRRAAAVRQVQRYYDALFGAAPELRKTRESYAMKEDTLPRPQDRHNLAAFFFWSAWAAATPRPGMQATYTNNWPHEPLIDNVPTAENVLWSVLSVVLLVAGIGAFIWIWSFGRKHGEEDSKPLARDPLAALALTPSQRALWKYLGVVVALFGLQVLLGGFTAHYTVEGQAFYGLETSRWLPYALTRTWHIQSAMFWIATAFLAAGLFLAPVINGGRDPKYQKLGVDLLFVALLVVVAGSFIGQFLAINQQLQREVSFWLGHQGYEYLDLGRVWQIALYAGLILWLALMLRAIVPALRREKQKSLLILFTASVIAVGLFYGAGLFYGPRTHLSVMEYWRWWVVHLWVEGFFEVFATVALAYIFSAMGLVSRTSAARASLAAATLFMLGGVPGTFHHLYFSGTTTSIMAIGAVFSALEVVPLVVVGIEAYENWRHKDRAPWMRRYEWPLKFFVAVAFWNFVGAGVFGFLINPPIALYYLQGLNTTAVHGHAALFGVYGFLALGLVLLVLRSLRPEAQWNEATLKTAFWWMNGGLATMIVTSLLPIGLYQFWASLKVGLWYARSEEFLQLPLLETLRWVRTVGDLVFIIGAFAFAAFVVQTLARRRPAIASPGPATERA